MKIEKFNKNNTRDYKSFYKYLGVIDKKIKNLDTSLDFGEIVIFSETTGIGIKSYFIIIEIKDYAKIRDLQTLSDFFEKNYSYLKLSCSINNFNNNTLHFRVNNLKKEFFDDLDSEDIRNKFNL